MTEDHNEKLAQLRQGLDQLIETNGRAQAKHEDLRAVVARMETLLKGSSMAQADIDGLREALRHPATRTHADLNAAVARLERLVIELAEQVDRLTRHRGPS